MLKQDKYKILYENMKEDYNQLLNSFMKLKDQLEDTKTLCKIYQEILDDKFTKGGEKEDGKRRYDINK